jgi:hypothetical protein
MDMVQGGADAGHIEHNVSLFEDHLLAEVVSQVTTGLQVHRKVAVAPDDGSIAGQWLKYYSD